MSHGHHDHPDIGCIEAIEGLYALLDGELSDPATVAQVEAHVAHCKSCFSRAQIERVITAKIRALHDQPEADTTHAPEHLQNRLRDLLKDL
jgi:anti-sigma factor (TIGR02949 family)